MNVVNPSHGSSISSASSASATARSILVLEQGVDQRVLVREAPVDRADPDARVGGDVVERDVQAPLGEDLGGGGEDSRAVALGVGAERASSRCSFGLTVPTNGR